MRSIRLASNFPGYMCDVRYLFERFLTFTFVYHGTSNHNELVQFPQNNICTDACASVWIYIYAGISAHFHFPYPNMLCLRWMVTFCYISTRIKLNKNNNKLWPVFYLFNVYPNLVANTFIRTTTQHQPLSNHTDEEARERERERAKGNEIEIIKHK